MYSNILFTIINIIFFYIKTKKYSMFTKHASLLNISNISIVTINIIILILSIMDGYFNNILLITSIIHFISYILNINRKIDINKTSEKMIVLSIISLGFIDRIGEGIYNNILIITFIFIIFLIDLYYIIKLLIKNRKHVCIRPNNCDILTDVKFSLKIELHKSINYFIYWAFLVILLKIRFQYIEFIYLIILILMIRYLIQIYNFLKHVLSDIDNKVIYQNEYPSKVESFIICKYLLRMRSLIYYIVFYSLTIIFFYLNKDIYISISLYMMYLYIIIDNKLYLINHIYSINNKLLTKDYKLSKNISINQYIEVNIFKLKLYKIKVKDYISTLIIFNPDLIIKSIDLRTNNKNSYIIDLSKYFM